MARELFYFMLFIEKELFMKPMVHVASKNWLLKGRIHIQEHSRNKTNSKLEAVKLIELKEIGKMAAVQCTLTLPGLLAGIR